MSMTTAERRAAYRRAGYCTYGPHPAEPGAVLCAYHADYNRKKRQEWRKNHRKGANT